MEPADNRAGQSSFGDDLVDPLLDVLIPVSVRVAGSLAPARVGRDWAERLLHTRADASLALASALTAQLNYSHTHQHLVRAAALPASLLAAHRPLERAPAVRPVIAVDTAVFPGNTASQRVAGAAAWAHRTFIDAVAAARTAAQAPEAASASALLTLVLGRLAHVPTPSAGCSDCPDCPGCRRTCTQALGPNMAAFESVLAQLPGPAPPATVPAAALVNAAAAIAGHPALLLCSHPLPLPSELGAGAGMLAVDARGLVSVTLAATHATAGTTLTTPSQRFPAVFSLALLPQELLLAPAALTEHLLRHARARGSPHAAYDVALLRTAAAEQTRVRRNDAGYIFCAAHGLAAQWRDPASCALPVGGDDLAPAPVPTHVAGGMPAVAQPFELSSLARALSQATAAHALRLRRRLARGELVAARALLEASAGSPVSDAELLAGVLPAAVQEEGSDALPWRHAVAGTAIAADATGTFIRDIAF
jgi:hypothetical protein